MSGGGSKRRGGLVHKKAHKLDGPKSEINVTPLVDVCLVLLIIFMVVTPLLARGKEVPLPKTKHHTEQQDKNQPIVAVDGKGRVYYDKEEVGNVVPNSGMVANPALQGAWVMDTTEVLHRRIEDAWHKQEEAGVTDAEGNPLPRKVFVKADPELPYARVYPVIMAVHELGISTIDLGTHELKERAE